MALSPSGSDGLEMDYIRRTIEVMNDLSIGRFLLGLSTTVALLVLDGSLLVVAALVPEAADRQLYGFALALSSLLTLGVASGLRRIWPALVALIAALDSVIVWTAVRDRSTEALGFQALVTMLVLAYIVVTAAQRKRH